MPVVAARDIGVEILRCAQDDVVREYAIALLALAGGRASVGAGRYVPAPPRPRRPHHALALMLFRLAAVLAALLACAPAGAQALPAPARAYLGLWLVPNEETGRPEAVMEVYEEGGAVHGRLVRSLEGDGPAVVCEACAGEYAGADLRGVRILRGLTWTGEGFDGGRVLDPRSGKVYGASLDLNGPNHLRVRGYLGVKVLGKTQVWQRADRSGGGGAGR